MGAPLVAPRLDLGEGLSQDGVHGDAEDGTRFTVRPTETHEGETVDEGGAIEGSTNHGRVGDLRELAVRRRHGLLPDEGVRRERRLEALEDGSSHFLSVAVTRSTVPLYSTSRVSCHAALISAPAAVAAAIASSRHRS